MSKNQKRQTSVLLVDDHAVVREGYRRLLERDAGITVIGEAADGTTAFELFCSLEPHVVVMDITMPDASGIDVMRRMLGEKSGAHILIFSMHKDNIFATRALQAGAFGYVTKASAPSVLVGAIHAVAAGEKYLSPDVAQKLALGNFTGTAREALSVRELEVLRMLAQGQTVKTIADSMGLSVKTVANHQSVIRQKLEAETAVELLRKAARLGLDT